MLKFSQCIARNNDARVRIEGDRGVLEGVPHAALYDHGQAVHFQSQVVVFVEIVVQGHAQADGDRSAAAGGLPADPEKGLLVVGQKTG